MCGAFTAALHLLSLAPEVGQQVSPGRVLCEEREWLLFCDTAHHADQVSMLALSHLLGLEDVLEEDLVVFVCGILCRGEQLVTHL